MNVGTHQWAEENTGYSAFEHLIAALFRKPEALMAIVKPDPLTLYCDASGKESDPLIVVAGAVSSVERWRRFDQDWKTALRENELRYFRMAEFAHSTGQFGRGWKGEEKRRQDFLRRLVQIAVSYVGCWVGAAIFKSDYEKADAIYQVHEFLQPYPFCSITCVELALDWARNQKLDYLPIEFVFEAGDEHWRQLQERMMQDYGVVPIQRTKEQAAALHLADFAAYEIRKAFLSVDEESHQLFKSFRTTLGMLTINIPHKWGNQTETGIRSLMNIRGVPRR